MVLADRREDLVILLVAVRLSLPDMYSDGLIDLVDVIVAVSLNLSETNNLSDSLRQLDGLPMNEMEKTELNTSFSDGRISSE